jgi:formylglycine-generating enzyme required for sulfatase activity
MTLLNIEDEVTTASQQASRPDNSPAGIRKGNSGRLTLISGAHPKRGATLACCVAAMAASCSRPVSQTSLSHWADWSPSSPTADVDGRQVPTVVVDRATGAEMILVLPGSYLRPITDTGVELGVPPQEVHITNPYYLARYEMTKTQFYHAMEPDGRKGPPAGQASDVPAVFASIEEVYTLLEVTGCRLPTEAEWEHAALVGARAASEVVEDGWTKENSGGELHPVGERRPTAHGFFDMIGNVSEVCADSWANRTTGYEVARVVDPVQHRVLQKMVGQPSHVLRGGNIYAPLVDERETKGIIVRAAYSPRCGLFARYTYDTTDSLLAVGVRVAHDL